METNESYKKLLREYSLANQQMERIIRGVHRPDCNGTCRCGVENAEALRVLLAEVWVAYGKVLVAMADTFDGDAL